MSTAARSRLPLIAPGQAQQELYHNEALAAGDAALHASLDYGPSADPPLEAMVGEAGSWRRAQPRTCWNQGDSLAAWTEGG
jgi:hypothetical protein